MNFYPSEGTIKLVCMLIMYHLQFKSSSPSSKVHQDKRVGQSQNRFMKYSSYQQIESDSFMCQGAIYNGSLACLW